MNTAKLSEDARKLANEHEEFAEAKERKARAEDVILKELLGAVKFALPAICSRMELTDYRGISLTKGFYLLDSGELLKKLGFKLVVSSESELLESVSVVAICAILTTAVRAASGRLTERTEEVRRETSILEGIGEAFKIGGVK